MFAPTCPGKPWHGQDVYILFGSTALASAQLATQQELLVGTYMRSAFAAFAYNSTHGLEAFSWPMFNYNMSNAINLGLNSTPPWDVASV